MSRKQKKNTLPSDATAIPLRPDGKVKPCHNEQNPTPKRLLAQKADEMVNGGLGSGGSYGSGLDPQVRQEMSDYFANNNRLLRRPEVEARTGLSRSTIYEWMKRGNFPQPVKLGDRLVAWRESDLAAWLETRETRTL